MTPYEEAEARLVHRIAQACPTCGGDGVVLDVEDHVCPACGPIRDWYLNGPGQAEVHVALTEFVETVQELPR